MSEKSHTSPRKASKQSNASSFGILRTQSFSVQHSEVDDYFSSKKVEQDDVTPRPGSQTEEALGMTKSFEDVGGLLKEEEKGD
jgi:hypothetical protein